MVIMTFSVAAEVTFVFYKVWRHDIEANILDKHIWYKRR